jgi:hypothetical protein
MVNYLRGRSSLLRPGNEEGRYRNEGQNTLAEFRRFQGETLIQLLQRLELAAGKAFVNDEFTGEVNPSK